MQNSEMQLAEILSDLVSLQPGVCPPTAALALVSARPSSSPSTGTTTTTSTTTTSSAPTDEPSPDPDLARAKQLVALHYDVRERCKTGELGRGLLEARWAVERATGV